MGIRFKASRTGLEPLESRAMLAADLTGTWVGLNLPAVPSGGAMPPVTLHVENTGDAPAAAGSTVEVYLSADNVLDPLTDTKIAIAKLPAIKPDAFKDVIFKTIKLPPGLDAGQLFLIARIDANNKNTETSEANNAIPSAAPITVTQPDYDLTGAMATPALGLQLIQGVANSGSVKLTLTNSGTAKLGPVAIDIAFFLRPDGNVDASGDLPIGALNNQPVALAANKSKTFTGKLALGTAVPAGAYRIVAVFDTHDSLAETSEANNVVVGTDVISLSAAFADLGITGGTVTAKPNIPAGAKALVSITVFNAGNVAATGTVGVSLVAKADGHPNVPLVTVSTIPFTAKAGLSRTVKITFNVPILLIDGVLYDVEATLTPVTSAGGDVLANNVALFGDAFTPDIPVVLVPDFGDRITFSAEVAASGDSANGASHKTGNFVDGNGRHGTYDYRNNENAEFETGTLILHWTDGLQPANRTYSLLYGNEGGPHALNGRTLKVFEDVNSEVVGQIASGFLNILGYVAF